MKEIYFCKHCGTTFEEFAIEKHLEDRGEFWGVQSYEEICECLCPCCGRSENETDFLVIDEYKIVEEVWDYFEENEMDLEVVKTMKLSELYKLESKIADHISSKYNNSLAVKFDFDSEANVIVEELISEF